MVRVTRRQAFVGGAAAAAAGYGLLGRFAVGTAFEDHVARELGLDKSVARQLVAATRDVTGADYEVRAAGFVAATTFPARHVMPRGMRHEAIDAFLRPMWDMEEGLVTSYAYAGLRDAGRYAPCVLRE